MKNVPNLRFKEFSGEWEQKKLEDFCDFCGGGTPSKGNTEFWNGDIAWVSSSDINENNINHINITRYITADAVKNSATKICPSNSILIVSRVGIGKVALSPTEVCTSQDFTNITNTSSNKKYLAYVISERMKREAQQSQGTSIKGITSNEIKSMKFFIPEVKEQEKIASFFSLIDKKIELQTEKVEELKNYKKGIMQKIFSQELRFKDENGNEYPEWEEKKLEEIATQIKRVSDIEVNDVLTISAGVGFLNQKDRFSQVIAGNSLNKYTLLYENEFSYNRGNSKKYTYGCIYRLKTYKQALVPNVYISFRLDNQIGGFYEQLFLNKYLDKQLRQLISSSARMDGLLNINKDEFFKVRVPIPQLKEQEKIASLLSSIDKKVEKEKEKLDALVDYKKGLLQQMFV